MESEKKCECEKCECEKNESKSPKIKPCENGCKCGCAEKKFCDCEKCDCKCPRKK